MALNDWSGNGWAIKVVASELSVTFGNSVRTFSSAEVARLDLKRSWWRWFLTRGDERLGRLRGLSSIDAASMAIALEKLSIAPAIDAAEVWHSAVLKRFAEGRDELRWISRESVDRLLATRPPRGLLDRIRTANLERSLSQAEAAAVGFLEEDLEANIASINAEIMTNELAQKRDFFAAIEKSPLTDEQAEAVICFDNRVQVLAAAGSGKTSVMVARAAYAVERGFVDPENILLLAFNKAAAVELGERITSRFESAGIESSGVRASTFHSFGLDVIGRATGKRPRLAKWLDQGEDVRMVLQIVDDLRDSSATFRYQWDLYRLIFANAPTDLEQDEPDGYDPKSRTSGYRTFAGEIVKSHGERLIANFLFLNGINYEYERSFPWDLADSTHSQYHPDFYYPEVDVWHEHWGLDRFGVPPKRFHGYSEGMEWKKGIHAKYGTTLVESSWGDVLYGDGLAKIKSDLTTLGLKFDWNPDRPITDKWSKPVTNESFARLVRTFMAHIKSNGLTKELIDERLKGEQSNLDGYRTRLFLNCYWKIHEAWEQRLRADGAVDFEDMLVSAAKHLEDGDIDFPYELIMVDEFQDASRARARLIRGLLRSPDRYLLAVGDDWQSVNRFAGADITVMTDFEKWFGSGPQLALTTTFRCTQTICDVASHFVSKNPSQFSKPMRSVHLGPGAPVKVIFSEHDSDALENFLEKLSSEVEDGRVRAARGGKVSVNVLGRYGFQRKEMRQPFPENLDVTFRTVHGAKGLEADFIVVLGLSTGTYGFPSGVDDDPVLAVAMPEADEYPHAEERRLFYVALTRARQQVVLLTPIQKMSPFIVELLNEPSVIQEGMNGIQVEACPKCQTAVLVERKNGKTGKPFFSCSRLVCTFTRNI